jgi:hypothetical protein
MNWDKTKTREQIIQEYIDWYIEGATLSELQEAVAQQMWDDLDSLPVSELVHDIRQYAPEIVENITLAV